MDANMEQARNDTGILLENSWIVSGTDTYSTGYNWQKRRGILTNFKNQMEQSQLHPCHLIYILVSIDSFLLKGRKPSVTEINTEANPWSILYHKTVAVGLVYCLLQKGHNQRPDTDDVANDLHQRSHREVPWHNTRLNDCRDAIQSLCSARFSLTMMNSIIENESKLPKTT